MVPKIVLVAVVSTLLAVCQSANIPGNYSHFTFSYNTPRAAANNNIALRSRALTDEQATINTGTTDTASINTGNINTATINTATTTSRPVVVETTTSSGSKTTPINDVDYWANDDFQPFKVDNRDIFDWRLLQEVFTKVKQNVVISPFSVKFVMAILSEAADAESTTKKELATIFNREASPQLMRENYRDLLVSLKEKSTKYTLNFATNMYVRSYVQPRPQYKRVLNENYDTDIQGLDFSQAEIAANTINDWCSNVTEGHLSNLVNSDNIQNSVLLLINAIYFDGKWRTPFVESYDSVFFRQPSEQIRAEYMTVKDKFYYFHSTMWNAKVIRLPYQGKKFSMTIILPGARGGIEELAREIEGDGLRRIQWLMTEQTVKVTLPKFKFDSTSHLKETLMALGINEIFSDGASLSGIAQGSSLFKQMKVTDFIQKAGIEVHESGTTAFAATDVEIVNKFGGDDSEEFMANRPFLFIIVDEATTNIIFAGKVLDPTA